MLNLLAIALLQFASFTSGTTSQTLTSAPVAAIVVGSNVAALGGTGGWGNDVAALGGTGGWGNDIAALGGTGGWGNDIAA